MPEKEQDEHKGEEEGIPGPARNLTHREVIGCTKRGVPENSSHKSSGFPISNISRAEKYVFLNAALSAEIAASCVEREEFKKTHFVGVRLVEAVKPMTSEGVTTGTIGFVQPNEPRCINGAIDSLTTHANKYSSDEPPVLLLMWQFGCGNVVMW